MDQLSSCYFCGDALDASLDTHPVVPPSVLPDADARTKVVLCGSCKRKLDPVVERVVDALGDPPARTDAGRDAGGGSGEGPSDPDAGAGPDIESTLGDDDDLLRPVGESDDDADGESGDGADATASEMQWGGEDGAADESAGDDGRASGGGGVSGAGSDGAPDGTGAGSDGAPDGTGAGSDGAAGGQRAGEGETEPNYTSGRRAGYTDEDDEETDDDGETDHTLTRLENTKVMRLLQNREFPVDRDDFVTVASSAYEVSPRKCQKVIDLAVDHDLLREEDGELYAGARWT